MSPDKPEKSLEFPAKAATDTPITAGQATSSANEPSAQVANETDKQTAKQVDNQLTKPVARKIFVRPERKTVSLRDDQVYISNQSKKPPWLTPLLASAVVLALILFILPRLFAPPAEPAESVPEVSFQEEEETPATALAVSTEVIIQGEACPLYAEPRHNAIRTSTALYGELARVIEQGPDDWVKLELAQDAYQGWCKASYLSTDLSAVDPAEAAGKVLVYSPYKRVMSHTIDGYTLFTAPMGSTLYYDYSSEQVLRLRLPQGQEGWISNSGIRLFAAEETIPLPTRAADLFASSAMNFFRTPYIPGGMTKEGADMAGVIYIAAKINGREVPRNLTGQATAGEKVTTVKDPGTGQIRANLLETGDIVFFHDGKDQRNIVQAAIILEEGQALTSLINDSILNLRDLNRETDLLRRVADVRRYFPSDIEE